MKYWSKVTNRRPNIALPFFHLKSDRFWHLHANAGYEKALEVTDRIKAISRLREVIAYATLDNDLFVLLTDTHHREIIRQTLIRVYFPDLKNEIESLIAEEHQIGQYRQLLIHEVKFPFSPQKPTASMREETSIRRAGFRQAIMGLYNYTCAVCRCISSQWTEKVRLMPLTSSRFIYRRMMMYGMGFPFANCTIGLLTKD